ncbi:TonB-dependent receptor [beta proteobacterium AAP121]|nr:TonB-dependent receptor [beta proteobacterium AAP65]KPF96575.1 TonB-dependent receptor [beta proteobacterium AAP121]
MGAVSTWALLGLPAAQAQTAAAPAAAASAPAAAGVQQITVTANRREQEQQKVSGVVQSISGDQLRRDGVNKVEALQQAVPGLSISNQEGNVEIFIRGVGSANNTELGDPGAAPHLNGIYIPRPRGLGLMFYDLERVEVNKGPQGTLYGRNAMAGTLNIITSRARLGQSGGYFQGEFSNRGGRAAEGAYNVPLGSTAALRLAGSYQERDHGFRNVSVNPAASGLRAAGHEENWALRLSGTWEPTESLRLTAVGDIGNERGTGYPAANIHSAVVNSGLRAEDLDLRQVVYRGLEGRMENRLGGLQFKASLALGGFDAEWSSSYREVDFYQRNSGTDSINWPGRDLAGINYDNYSNQWWQTRSQSEIHELRLSSSDPNARLKWTAGLFHFNEDQQVGFLSLADRGYCCYSGTEFTMPDVNGRSSAIFADGSFELAPAWRVLAGLRYTEESKYRYGIGGNLALTLGGEDFACCVATRFGTEGFVPTLLDRPTFDLSQVVTEAQKAQFLIDATRVPGQRDTLVRQIQAIANGSNPRGTCFTRPDIDNGFVQCPSANPSNTNGGFSYANLTIPDQQVGSSTARYGDFRIGFEHDLSRDHLVYAKLSTGHKSGGFNDSFRTTPVPEVFKPEKVSVLEIGSRQTVMLAGRRAVFNVTGFWYDYTDQAFQDLTCINIDPTATPPCTGYSLVNRNIGKSRIAGVEMEGRFVLARSTTLDLNFTWLDTKITKGQVADARAQDFSVGGNTPLVNLAGNRLPLASELNLSARLQQAFALGGGRFDWQALLSYRSDYYLTQFNEDEVRRLDNSTQTALSAGFPDKQKGYATLNLGLGYTTGPLRVELFVNNATNEQVSQKALVGSGVNVRFVNDARSYGLRGRVNF